MSIIRRLVLLGLIALFVSIGAGCAQAYCSGDWGNGHRLVYHHHHLGYWVRHYGEWEFVRV